MKPCEEVKSIDFFAEVLKVGLKTSQISRKGNKQIVFRMKIHCALSSFYGNILTGSSSVTKKTRLEASYGTVSRVVKASTVTGGGG
jgi:hypothetical protein